ncbi:hypothetical protein [Streptomyces sp. NPDC055709]
MSDLAMRTTDQVQVTFKPPLSVVIPPGILKGSATHCTAQGQLVCLQGDELPDALKITFPYTRIDTPPYAGGFGTLELTLDSSNLTEKTNVEGKKVLLKGKTFKAKFKVDTPALQPQPGAPPPPPKRDDNREYEGDAVFITSNSTVKFG